VRSCSLQIRRCWAWPRIGSEFQGITRDRSLTPQLLLEFGLTPDPAERAARQTLIGARQREKLRYKSGITH
jgi:hypothetical protein